MPDYSFDNVYQITPCFLKENGIRALLCDIDNTLAPYEESDPNDDLIKWIHSLQAASIQIGLLSNNGTDRVDKFNRNLSLFAVADAKKPSTKGIQKFICSSGIERQHIAVVGDQLFTDILMANRAGVGLALIVPPIRDKKTLFFRFKRRLEKPILRSFKKAGRNQKRM